MGRVTTKRVYIAIFLIGVFHLLSALSGLQSAGGKFPQKIAQSILEGHGYSVPADHWSGTLFQEDGTYVATANKEPVYPLLIAGSRVLFGDRGQLAIRLLQAIAVILTAVVLFDIAQYAFSGTSLGLITAFLWLLHPISFMSARSDHGTAFSGLAVVIACALVVRMMRQRSARRSLLIGVAVGLLSMVYTGVLVSVLLCAVALSLQRHYKVAALLIAGAVVAVAPWTIRNWIVLDALVPGRAGLGFNLHYTNPILARTYSSVKTDCARTPPWRARGPTDAVRTMRRDKEKRHALQWHGSDCIRDTAPAGYDGFTEAQRDRIYQNRALSFMFENPAICFFLTVAKTRDFLVDSVSWSRKVITMLAVVGGFLALTQLESAFLALLTAGLCLPYVLSVWFVRYYRLPIEPLFFLLAISVLVRIAQVISNKKEPATSSEQ